MTALRFVSRPLVELPSSQAPTSAGSAGRVFRLVEHGDTDHVRGGHGGAVLGDGAAADARRHDVLAGREEIDAPAVVGEGRLLVPRMRADANAVAGAVIARTVRAAVALTRAKLVRVFKR